MNKLKLVAVSSLSLALTSCGLGSGTLNFTATSASSRTAKGELSAPSVSALAVTTFKVCIKKVELEDESGEAQRQEGSETDEIEFKPGLVDLSTIATSEVTIGSLDNAPTGFKISKIKIKVKKDTSLCGASSHAIEINNGSSYNTDDEIEFRWKFSPAVELAGGDTVQLAFSEFVTALASVSSGSAFATAIPGAEGTARIKNK